MSYTGVKSFKVVSNEQGLVSIKAKCYDSSIRDMKGNRVWGEYVIYDFMPKEKLEKILFSDIFYGNLHYTGGGKYALIKRTKLPISDTYELQKLNSVVQETHDKLWAFRNEMYAKGIKYEQYVNDSKYKELAEQADKAYKVHRQFEVETYFREWKALVKEHNELVKSGVKYRVWVNRYGGVYAKSIGSRTMKYTQYKECAKLFSKTEQELNDMLKDYDVEYKLEQVLGE